MSRFDVHMDHKILHFFLSLIIYFCIQLVLNGCAKKKKQTKLWNLRLIFIRISFSTNNNVSKLDILYCVKKDKIVAQLFLFFYCLISYTYFVLLPM
jgi:hypothetical protein